MFLKLKLNIRIIDIENNCYSVVSIWIYFEAYLMLLDYIRYV